MSADLMTVALALAALPAGYAAGLLHFRSLRRIADMIVAGRLSAIALQATRLGALAGFLVLCALAGAPVLIAAAAGLLVGRARVMREARQ